MTAAVRRGHSSSYLGSADFPAAIDGLPVEWTRPHVGFFQPQSAPLSADIPDMDACWRCGLVVSVTLGCAQGGYARRPEALPLPPTHQEDTPQRRLDDAETTMSTLHRLLLQDERMRLDETRRPKILRCLDERIIELRTRLNVAERSMLALREGIACGDQAAADAAWQEFQHAGIGLDPTSCQTVISHRDR
jgi:hypothetical protein